MSKALFQVGDKVRLSLDGFVYTVYAISPENTSIPQERFYFLTFSGRWPWALAKTHTVPESVAGKLLTKT